MTSFMTYDGGDPSDIAKDGSSRDRFGDWKFHDCGTKQGGLSCDRLGDCEHGGDYLGTIEGRSSRDELGDCEHGGDSLGAVRMGHLVTRWVTLSMVVILWVQ